MKTKQLLILITLFSGFLFSCDYLNEDSSDASIISIKGEITNPNSDSVWITLKNGDTKYSAVLDSSGQFNMTLSDNKAGEATFFDGNEIGHLYLTPGDNIILKLDTKEFDESIRFEGKGSNVNNYLAAKYLEFDDKGALYIYNMRDSLGVDGGLIYLDELQNRRANFLLNYINKNNLSNQEFVNWENTNIEFEYPSLLFQYTYNKHNDTTLDTIYSIFSSYMSRIPVDSLSEKYRYFLNDYPTYLYHEYSQLLSDRNTRDSVMFELINSSTAGYARNYLLAYRLNSFLDRYDTDSYDKYSYVIDENLTNNDMKQLLIEKYHHTKKLLAAGFPDGANVVNLENEEFSNISYNEIIDKYKGKVIYLDFWASWCSPCKEEMPFSLELQKYYQDKDVAFVYFSSDKDSTAWKSLIKILKITGDHYRLSKNVRKTTNELYNVKYIPRYVLLDKNGKIIDENAKRPSNPEIIIEIDSILSINN